MSISQVSGWQDNYLPTVPHCWASVFDPYRINDILWEVPYWPCLKLAEGDWIPRPALWILERFNPNRHLWPVNFSLILKDWIFAKNPMYWRILRERLIMVNGESYPYFDYFDFFKSQSELSFKVDVAGSGDLFISFLYEGQSFWSDVPKVGANDKHDGYWLNQATGRWLFSPDNGGLPQGYSFFNSDGILAPTRLEVYPESSCDEDFKYDFSSFPEIRYFRRGYRHFKVNGTANIDFREVEFEGNLDGTEIKYFPLLGSFVIDGDPSLVYQVKKALNWYLYDNLHEILERIDCFCAFDSIKSALNSQGVAISEIGHLHKDGCSASLGSGDAAGFERCFWGIVLPYAQSQRRTYDGWNYSSNVEGAIHLLISVIPLEDDLSPSFTCTAGGLEADIFRWMGIIPPADAPPGTLVAQKQGRPPGFDVGNNDGAYTYFFSAWSEFPNLSLSGLIFGWPPDEWDRQEYLRMIMRNLSLNQSSPYPGEEGWFLKYGGAEPELIIDPLWHYIRGDLAGTTLDPEYNSNNCSVKEPFAGEEWLDLAAIADPERTIIQNYLGTVGLIDKPRLFYPAINDLWDSGADVMEPDCRPFRIEWAKRGTQCWELKHGESGRVIHLDQPEQEDIVRYLQEVWGWGAGGLQWTSFGWQEIQPWPFSEEVIENWLYTVWGKEIELYEKVEKGEIAPFDWATFQAAPWLGLQGYQKYNIGTGMPIDSPRLIELHHAMSAREFAYLPESTGDKPDRVWTLGKMLEMLTKVMGIRFTPDGAIQSIRQKSVIRSGEDIPLGWPMGQWGINKATGEGSGTGENEPQRGGIKDEECPGIAYKNRSNRFDEDPYSGKVEKILPGDYVLCESLPQYWDQILDDLQHALGWQELGALAIPAADGTDKKATIEGLGAAISEMIFMLSAISQQTAQGQVSSLKNQAMILELIKMMGMPLVSQTFPVDLGFDEEPAYSVPYPGLAEDAPTIGQLFGAVLTNLALLQTSLLSGKNTKAYQDAKEEAEKKDGKK